MNMNFINETHIRRRKPNKMKKAAKSLSENYAIAYYLYRACEEMKGDYIPDEALSLFLNCAHNIGVDKKVTHLINSRIESLKEKKILTPLHEQIDEDDAPYTATFDDSSVVYKYEQDKRVDRDIRFDGVIDENVVNLYRCVVLSERPFFPELIAKTLFVEDKPSTDKEEAEVTNADYLDSDGELIIPAKIRKYIEDISQVKFLVDQVNLSRKEALFLLLLYRISSNYRLRAVDRRASEEFHSCFTKILGTTEAEYHTMLRTDQKLKSFGFIDDDNEYNQDLNECIETGSIDPYFSDLLKTMDTSEAYDLETFSVNKESSSIMEELIKGKNPVSILLYGKPGSGKTEYAKALCKKTGKNAYIFKNEMEVHQRYNPLFRLNCLLSIEKNDSVIIVDEADNLLKTQDFTFFGVVPSKTKGTVNKMLENNKDKVIWITNHLHQTDQSTRRRFTFSLKFETMPSAMLRSIAETKLQKLNLSDETKAKLLDMFSTYQLTGASVDNIVKTLDGMTSTNEEEMLSKAKIVMKENSLLLNGNSKMRDKVKESYDSSVINSSIPAEKIVRMVTNANKFAEKNKNRDNSIRILFYGVSGTGKTELARYIAEKLNKKILLKRASDILGKYVGENEQNIRDAFEEAEATDQILLFDEADSFFTDRSASTQHWQSTMVNEFLTQMEEFSGILICTTNLRNIMDPAMQRRFHMLVEMKPMKYEGIEKMLHKYFAGFDFTERQISKLEDYNTVTPGDFGSLSSRIRFMDQEEITSSYILNELILIQEEKMKNQYSSGRTMGFTA